MPNRLFPQHSVLGTRYFFFDCLYLLVLVAYILAGTALVPFHGDEATQIYMSRDYAYQFLQGDLDRLRYSDPPVSAQEQELRLLNGTVNKDLIGLAWHLDGFTVDQINQQWDWGADWNYNTTTNHAPSAALLQISRVPSALLLAAGVVVIFVLGRVLGGRPVAYLAAAYYALCPPLLLDGRRAMMEGSLIAFLLLTVLAGVLLLRKRAWWTPILLGGAAGLALASKHTAAFTVIAVFGAVAAYPVIRWAGARLRGNPSPPTPSPTQAGRGEQSAANFLPSLKVGGSTYLLLIIAGVIALLTFYALNPAWWGDPIARASTVLDLRADLLQGQTEAFGGYADPGDALGGFFRQVFVAQPQYYEIPAWQGYIGDQIARYEASIWHGVAIGGSTLGGIVLLGLLIAGLVALWRDRSVVGSTRWLIGVWALAMLLTTALLTPLEWQRYYLPAYPAVGLVASYGVVWVLRVGKSELRKTP